MGQQASGIIADLGLFLWQEWKDPHGLSFFARCKDDFLPIADTVLYACDLRAEFATTFSFGFVVDNLDFDLRKTVFGRRH